MNMNTKQKIQFALNLARQGKFGTPDNPIRGSTGRCHFWDAFTGMRSASYFKNTLSYPYAKAGELYKKELGT